jgi:hypothetical protein
MPSSSSHVRASTLSSPHLSCGEPLDHKRSLVRMASTPRFWLDSPSASSSSSSSGHSTRNFLGGLGLDKSTLWPSCTAALFGRRITCHMSGHLSLLHGFPGSISKPALCLFGPRYVFSHLSSLHECSLVNDSNANCLSLVQLCSFGGLVLRHCHLRHHHLLCLAIHRHQIRLVGQHGIRHGLRGQGVYSETPCAGRVLWAAHWHL